MCKIHFQFSSWCSICILIHLILSQRSSVTSIMEPKETPGTPPKGTKRKDPPNDDLYLINPEDIPSDVEKRLVCFPYDSKSEEPLDGDPDTITRNDVDEDVLKRLVHHPSNPNSCTCGIYVYLSSICGHMMNWDELPCGSSVDSETQSPRSCTRPPPMQIIDYPRIHQSCVDCFWVFNTVGHKLPNHLSEHIQPDRIADDVRLHRLVRSAENPGNCECGWYRYKAMSCPHIYKDHAYRCGARTSKEPGKEVFCGSKAPVHLVESPEIRSKCRFCEERGWETQSAALNAEGLAKMEKAKMKSG